MQVFDVNGEQIADMPNVQWSTITVPGALVVGLEDPPGARTLVRTRVFAPGRWADLAELAPAADDPAPAPPFVPGDFEADVRAVLETSDAARIRAALQVQCTCAELRCTNVLNPASPEEKEQARNRWRLFPTVFREEQPEPLQQCVRARGHDPVSMPCYWQPGVWLWGIHNHHQGCPRHPSRYNVPQVEGQPQEAAGVTTTGLMRALVEHTSAAPQLTLAEPNIVAAQRAMWKVCAVKGPAQGPRESDAVWCTKPHEHDEALHEMDRGPEGVVSWLGGGR